MGDKIIFLDIDGVLRPMNPYVTIRSKEQNLPKVLSERYQEEAYEHINEYILRNVYYDFNGEACYCVRMLCNSTNAKIVLSTSWRDFYDLQTMKKLFDLHKLGVYIIGKTIQKYGNRPLEIQDYLDTHPEVEHYLIIDDMNLSMDFPNHCIITKDHLFLKEYRQGYNILMGL